MVASEPAEAAWAVEQEKMQIEAVEAAEAAAD